MELFKNLKSSALLLRRTLKTMSVKIEPTVLIHGGAGDILDNRVPGKVNGVKIAAREGYIALKSSGNVLDAVEAAIRYMEDDEAFNCGYGSVLNVEGEIEMDASIMNGCDLSAGGVTVVKDIAHPISLARLVMEKTQHILLAGCGANKFAKDQGIPTLPSGKLVTPLARETLEKSTEFGGTEVGTVGAIALDHRGHIAAGTSTGGLNRKMVGRSSDSSKLGCGTYADDNIGAVSTTGHGESIAKICLAHAIIKAMEQGLSATEATQKCIMYMFLRLHQTAGAITMSSTGDIGIAFNTPRMGWAYQRGDRIHFGVDLDEHKSEKV